MNRVNNKRLYDYILKNYVLSKKPLSILEIAKGFGTSTGNIKNFMYRHKLNKKTYYEKRREEIKRLRAMGLRACEISKAIDMPVNGIYKILRKEGENGKG